ncbi:hypothetical protein Q7P37_011063 [Cladosporium fusiforme]
MASPNDNVEQIPDDAGQDAMPPDNPPPSNTQELTPYDTFGHILGGLSYSSHQGEDALADHRRAYQLRRDLVELMTLPEGYKWTYIDVQGNSHEIIILSPPDMIAVRRSDGLWERQFRRDSPDEPAPYDEDWYAEYLAISGLPAWFMRPAHRTMLNDDVEPRAIGMDNAPSNHFTFPHDYLEQLYPEEVAYPVPMRGESYVLSDLTNMQGHLARAFPAINVENVQSSVVVLPSGHIQLRSEPADMPAIGEEVVEWMASKEVGLASYCLDPLSSDPQAEAQAVIAAGGLVNPANQIMGVGTLGWLNPAIDEPHARAMGYNSPDEVTMARQQNALPVGLGENARPFVVFWPAQEFLNPAVQPAEEGAWRFLTTGEADSDEGWAALNIGNSNGLPAHPTAAQVYRLRQWLVARQRVDITHDINIVWAPGAEPEDDTWSPPDDSGPAITAQPPTTSAGPDESTTNPPPATTTTGVAAATTNEHDPTNGQPGGEHDQTGSSKALYDMVVVHGERITVDRSRCHAGHVEPHKLWCYGARGWKIWGHAATMDWNDAKKIAALNKYREQTHQRARFWRPLRDVARLDYTVEQREWLMEWVAEARGQRPVTSMTELTAQFNEHFGTDRGEGGIQSLFDRLRAEWHVFGGLADKPGRGQAQKDASRQSRGVGSTPKTPVAIPPIVVSSDSESEDDDDDE